MTIVKKTCQVVEQNDDKSNIIRLKYAVNIYMSHSTGKSIYANENKWFSHSWLM